MRSMRRIEARRIKARALSFRFSQSSPSITFRTGIPRSQGGVAAENHQPVLAKGSLIQVRAKRLDDFASCGVETVRTSRPTLVIELQTSFEYDGVLHFLDPLSYDVAWSIPPEGFPRQCFAFSRLLHESGRAANWWQSRKFENLRSGFLTRN